MRNDWTCAKRTHPFRNFFFIVTSTLTVSAALAANTEALRDDLAAPQPVPAGVADPAFLDPDADGVLNSDDNCPFLPNPKRNDGTQRLVCSNGAPIERQVYLKSRTFSAPQGLDPKIERLPVDQRAHVFLHFTSTSRGTLLTKSRRTALASLDVNILGYVPDDTYYVSFQPNTATLQSILSIDGVLGISARSAADRVAPAIRLRGALDRADDGSFELAVEFFEDIGKTEIESLFAKDGLAFRHQYDTSYHVRFNTWDELAVLAKQDGVKWIDEMDDAPVGYTQNAQATISGTLVSEHFGYRGDGMTVAMMEPGPLRLNPPHPDMVGRLTIGNIPTFAYDEGQHAWNVASILIADETSYPKNRGFLPDAHLVSYAADRIQTRKRRYFGIPKEAREDHDALLINNSWGHYKCGKIGEYTGHAKFRDRAVFDEGIIIVDGAGNGRAPDTYPDDGCNPDQSSLGLVNAKNSIMVGNWSLDTNSLDYGSSKGPAADGRLKPDVVAPGSGIDTLDFWITGVKDVSGTPNGGLQQIDLIGESRPITFYGTSAAAPVASGVVGWIGEAFLDQGYTVQSILPAAVKAILIHTARDVGLPGPDFDHGYGLIQAGPAVRIAQEWTQWGRQHTFTEEGDSQEFLFDIASDLFTYKVTMAWDDLEGEDTTNKSLKNDLDLIVVSPSGVEYRPFDLRAPFGLGDTPAIPCTSDPCDQINNVEQVLFTNSNGTPLETGQWRAIVTARRLVSDEQAMALVLTPPCPVIITQDVTLTGPLSCSPSAAQPSAVEIPVDGVTLNCDEQSITGSDQDAANIKDYVGVRVLGNDVGVQHCVISRFDTGIKAGDDGRDVAGGRFTFNALSDMHQGAIDVRGDEHTVSENNIDSMKGGALVGIRIQGNRNLVSRNELYTSSTGDSPVGIYVEGASSINAVSANYISDMWNPAIHLDGKDDTDNLVGSIVTLNILHENPGVGIKLSGRVTRSQVDFNLIEWYGRVAPAIHVEEVNGKKPDQNTIAANIVRGSQTATQGGILVNNADFTIINSNILTDVGVGVTDIGSDASWIENNRMFSLDTEQPWSSLIGVIRQGGTVSHLSGNNIKNSRSGISVAGTSEQLLMRSNTIDALNLGISVLNSVGDDISGNTVSAQLLGISYIGGTGATLDNNTVTGYLNTGMYAANADNITLSNNTLTESTLAVADTTPSIGLHYGSGTTATVSSNTITSSTGGIGIQLGGDPPTCTETVVNDVTVELNTFSGVSSPLVAGCDVGTYTYTP